MHLEYPAQLEAKRAFVSRALVQHGLLDATPVPVVASPAEEGYRRRTTVRGRTGPDGPRLGLLRRGTHDLVDLPSCQILHPQLSLALESVRSAVAVYVEGSVGDFKLQAVCDTGSRVGLEFCVDRPLVGEFADVCGALAEAGIEAVRLVDCHGTLVLEEGDPRQFVARTLSSEDGPVELRFSLHSFTQLNFEQNQALVAHVETAAREVEPARIVDLYSGIGNYSLPLARHAREVVSVESSMSSVADARDNGARLGLTNIRCVRLASGAAVRELLRRGERIDLVVLNPTRAGAESIVESLCKLAPRRICYVSCSPPTLARDLAVLVHKGYTVTSITPFDMFPQTYHVETVAVLDRLR
jgi:23S rRNA (uracil1939-C5)-methyltransferase